MAQPDSVRALFFTFNSLALRGFGGVLPWAQHVLVDERGWLERDEFVELLSLAQVLPGPNICNLALMVGDRFFGWRGALAAVAGMLAAPLVVVMALALLYTRFAHVPQVAGAMHGMAAVAAGLIFAMGLKLAPTMKKSPLPLALCVAAALATWVGIGALRVPMAWLVLGLGGGMVGFAWWWLGVKAKA